ncbi:unnamed protein product [Menidia menidia]|uniref:(Atlantic silverside) hypothetical protein n=1 Tax=Menidia menidia TaxID=238744 RepID=A0A8S4ABE5_9TELE|nr:unnamed protein product [Menidia menidia]
MDPLPEYSLFLGRILEELDTKRNTMTYQDLCQSLCARFDLVHLAKIRSLLFYTACLDPAFPATLFKEKMCCSTEDALSKKLMVAADIVTMFNLIQVNGDMAKDRLPAAHKPKTHKKPLELRRSDSDAFNGEDYVRITGYEHTDHPRDGHHHHHHHGQLQPPLEARSNSSECNNCQFIPTSDPNFLLHVSKELKCSTASPDKLHHLPQISGSSPPSVASDMQSTYFPMDIDSESVTDQESLQPIGHPDSLAVYSCTQKRNVFKEDFHNLVAFSPKVVTSECKKGSKAGDGYPRRDMHKPATFFNRSFELHYSNPYFESPVNAPLHDRLRVKHESLDDLQASTYFGPTTVSEHVTSKKYAKKAGKQPAWPVKSFSLNTEEGPQDFDRPVLNSKVFKENHPCNISVINTDSEQHFQCPKETVVHSPGFGKTANGIKSKNVALMARGPTGLDKQAAAKRLWDKSKNGTLFEDRDSSSVGTQTEQAEQKKEKDYLSKYHDRERHNLKHSEMDAEMIRDDISDIFRFLDDMSVCDSLGIVQPSHHNSNGSLSQGTLKSDVDSSPERNTVKLAKSKLDRLFNSLENTDDELKLSVCKLVRRIGEIEKKLESLSGVRTEISQVLSKLNKLDEKIQEPETNERHGEKTSGSESGATPDKPHPNPSPLSSNHLPSNVFQCHTTGHNVKLEPGHTGEWVPSDESNSNSLRLKAPKRTTFTRRPSCSTNEENCASEPKVVSITSSASDWRTMPHTCHQGNKSKDKDRERESKDRHRRAKEAEREQQYELYQSQRPPKLAKDPYLIEQVFSSHPISPSVKAHVKGNLLYTDPRSTSLADAKRSQASWTMKEYRCNLGEKGNPLTALDLQTQESLNPNNLEFWMEDVYMPGYNSLLKKKEAEFRRAKACKIGALIAAATCTVILVIVVPICTMTS